VGYWPAVYAEGSGVSEQILIATLGSEPQVVTLALDLLRARDYPITAVKIVYTMGESVRSGLDACRGIQKIRPHAVMKRCRSKTMDGRFQTW
jgi:hypothetical protein